MPTPATCIEFTPPKTVTPAWLALAGIAFLPSYLARQAAAGERALAWVVAADANTVTLALEGKGNNVTLPAEAVTDVVELPMKEAPEFRIATPVKQASLRLVVTGVIDAQMNVEIWQPARVAAVKASV